MNDCSILWDRLDHQSILNSQRFLGHPSSAEAEELSLMYNQILGLDELDRIAFRW